MLFGLGLVGAVRAKVCQSLQELPVVEVTDDITGRAWRILAEADEAFGIKNMAYERVARSNRLAPNNIPDYLMFIKNEAEIQGKAAAKLPAASKRMVLVKALEGISSELRELVVYSYIYPSL
jgi:hypothetical protein